MINTVIKRNGTEVKFEKEKISRAIKKAYDAAGKYIIPMDLQTLTHWVCEDLEDKTTVEEIQNKIEEVLVENKEYEVVKAFILYRNQHTEDREIADKVKFLTEYCKASNAASGSKYDANANVDNKNIATLVGELPKASFIRLNRKLLVDKIKELYGKELANKYLDLLNKHFIYKNDETSIYPYCASITMYPWLLNGTKGIGGNSTAPTNLKSFCGGFINMVFIVSSMLSGACSTPEVLVYMTWFIQKEYGKDFYKHADDIVDLSIKKRTIDKVITDCFEQIVYSLNQPTGARNFQAVFWNVSYYDKYYFNALFENFYFPDGTQPDWEAVSWVQKRFMKWFNKERTKTVLTFPVETMAMLTENGKPKDEEWADFAAEMYAEGHSFFTYMSDRADSLSSCCFSPGTRFLWKDSINGVQCTRFKEYFNLTHGDDFEVFHNGKWVKGRVITAPNRQMYKVTTWQNQEFIMTDNHINVTLEGEKPTCNLSTDDYLMFNCLPLPFDDFCEEALTYEQGYSIGEYLKDGTYTNYAFIQRWVLNIKGKTRLNLNCLLKSIKFRKGIIEGLGNHSIEVKEEELARDIEVILTSLGYISDVHKKGNGYYISHIRPPFDYGCVKMYNNSAYVKIQSIEKNDYDGEVYCIECEDPTEPYFTLPNGLITHNCRLRNEIQDNEFSYTLGAGGISTGSKSVLTININRCVQYAKDKGMDYLEYLNEITDLCHKVQIAYNENVKTFLKYKMLPLYDAGYININRQYLTIGVNGIVESAEYLGIPINVNDEYKRFVQNVLGVIEKKNKEYRTKELMFNCEMIPAENVGVKHAKWDKEDGYKVNRDCYNSYFYKVEDDSLSVIDKFKLHGRDYIEHLTGGSALHMNLDSHLSKAQYKQLFNIAATEGCNYFTFNIPNTVCNSCGHIDKRYLKECPECGSKDVDYLTRIIGYLRKISNFSEARQIEANKRVYSNGREQI